MRGLLKRNRQPRTEQRSNIDGWQEIAVEGLARWFYATYGNSSISVDRAIRQPAVWACVRVLTTSASTLPLFAVRTTEDARQPVKPTPLVLRAPSVQVKLDVWLTQLFWSLNTDGNTFGRIANLGPTGLPTVVEWHNASQIGDRKVVDGIAQVRIGSDYHQLYPYGDIFHIPGLIVPAGQPFGLSPIEYAARSINTALSAEDFASGFFDGGGHPSGLLKMKTNPGETGADRLKEKFIEGTSTRQPVVLTEGVEYEQVQVNPTDSQFIDTLRFEVENVARVFGVPPSMVYAGVSGQSVTYANVSQADLAYLKHSLDPLLVRVENNLTDLLPRPQEAKFNRNALLRADSKARSEEHEIRLRTKTRTVNEVRKLEDEEPFSDPKFDEPGIPGGELPDTAPAPTGGT